MTDQLPRSSGDNADFLTVLGLLASLFFDLQYSETPAVTPAMELAKLALVTSKDEEEDEDKGGTDSSNDTDATLVEDGPSRISTLDQPSVSSPTRDSPMDIDARPDEANASQPIASTSGEASSSKIPAAPPGDSTVAKKPQLPPRKATEVSDSTMMFGDLRSMSIGASADQFCRKAT